MLIVVKGTDCLSFSLLSPHQRTTITRHDCRNVLIFVSFIKMKRLSHLTGASTLSHRLLTPTACFKSSSVREFQIKMRASSCCHSLLLFLASQLYFALQNSSLPNVSYVTKWKNYFGEVDGFLF